MSLILFYDTETTGLPLWNEPSGHPGQPHIVQLAAALVDSETRKVEASINLVVFPAHWTIPDEVAAVHGISTEKATIVGVEESQALMMFLSLWEEPFLDGFRLRVAHNETFDARIIRIAMKRYIGDAAADSWKVGPAHCTARMATPVCALPPTEKMRAVGRNHPKTPNLQEAYNHFFGHDFEDAHSALADVEACMAVYWKLKELEAA